VLSPKDMEGKSYATWGMPVEQAMIRHCVSADGGDPDKIKWVDAYVDDIQAGLGTVADCVWIFYGWDGIIAKTKGMATNFFYFKDIDPVFDYYTPVIVANNNFLNKNPGAAKAFLNACRRGYEFAAANPEKAAGILLNENPALDKAAVLASQSYLSGQYISDAPRWGYIDKTRWDAFYAWLCDNNLSDKKLLGKQFFTNEFLN